MLTLPRKFVIIVADEREETVMKDFKIGVMINSFRKNHADAMKLASEMGADGIQVYATSGDMAPENMTKEKIQAYKTLVRDNGLVISALCGDLGKGFSHRELNPELIERSKRIIELAKELGTDIVTTHIGVVPEDKNSEKYKTMQEACEKLAAYADSLSSHFAIETGPEPAKRLRDFLDSLGSHGVAVNLDPANLTMVTGDDAVQAVYTLRDYIVHTHAKDGRMLQNVDPLIVYGEAPAGTQKPSGRTYEELPLGKGDVDFPAYLKALDEIGYHGFLTVEREVGDNPTGDIGDAVKFLRNLMK